VRSLAPEELHRTVRNPMARHTPTETPASQAVPVLAAPPSARSVSTALGASSASRGDEDSRTSFAVRWPSWPVPAALAAQEAGGISSYAKNQPTTNRPEGTRLGPSVEVEPAKSQQSPSEAAFNPTMFTGAFAITLVLGAALLKVARRLKKQDQWRTGPGWLDGYQQLRSDLGDTAGCRSELRNRPGHKATRTDPADLKAGLQQLVRDLRRAEGGNQAVRPHREGRYPALAAP
jgi:hypothetical protein